MEVSNTPLCVLVRDACALEIAFEAAQFMPAGNVHHRAEYWLITGQAGRNSSRKKSRSIPITTRMGFLSSPQTRR